MANDSKVGALRVEASLDTGKFVAGTKTMRSEVLKTETQVNKSMKSMKGSTEGFLGALTIGAFTALVSKSLEYAGSLAELAQQLGVTTKDLQVFRYAAGQVGVSNSQLETGLSKLTITLGKVAAGATAPAKAFQAIGISVADLKGKDAGQAFRMIADGLGKVSDRSQRAAVEVALFGKSGSQLDNLLSGGSKSINELGAAAEKLGIILSDEQIQKADETADKIRAVKTVLEAQIAGVVVQNADSILTLASALSQLTGAVVKFLGSNPQAALAIIGALAGGRVGGAYGAVAGGVGGALYGTKLAHDHADQNMDPKFRKQQLLAASAHYKEVSGRSALGGGFVDTKNQAAVELIKQNKLAQQAIAMANRPKSKAGGGTIPQFLAPKPPKEHAAHSPRTPNGPKDYTDRNNYQFDQDQLRNQKDIIAAQRDLAVNTEDRAKFSLQLIQLDHDEEASKIDYAQKEGKLTASQADKLRSQNDTVTALRKEAVARDVSAQKAEDEQMLARTSYDIKRSALQAQSELATTAAERRRIELALLDLAYNEQKARLEVIAANKDLSDAVREQARMQLAAMPAQKALDRQAVVKGTQGPLQSYLDGIPHTAEQMNEALQSLEVQGLDGLTNALSHVGEGWKAMRDIALSAIKDILASLIKLELQKALLGAIGGLTGGSNLGASILSDTSSTIAGFDMGPAPFSSDAPFHFATGGSFTIGGNAGVDRNLLSINGLPVAKVGMGERVSVTPRNDNGPMMNGGNSVIYNIQTPDSDSFRRSERQITTAARRRLHTS